VESISKYKNSGFSLLEVMIAITLFAFFVTAFLASQGYNVSDSALSEEQLILQSLAEKKISQLHLDPPKFSNATENLNETKTFEEKEYENYEYNLEIKKLEIPDFAQLFSQVSSNEESDQDSFNNGDTTNSPQRNSGLEKIVLNELKENLEKIIWQARVTITNKETKYSFSLSTYLTNYNENIQFKFNF